MSNISQFELKKVQTDFPQVKISSSQDSYDFIKKFYSDDIEIFESFFILLLNRQNVTMGYAKISQGGVAGTIIDKKIISKYVVDSLASGVILAHNHPSGNLKPSNADIKMTRQIKEVVELLDSNVLDHLIVTNDSYFSFADERYL